MLPVLFSVPTYLPTYHHLDSHFFTVSQIGSILIVGSFRRVHLCLCLIEKAPTRQQTGGAIGDTTRPSVSRHRDYIAADPLYLI